MSGLQSCLVPLRTELGRCSDGCAALTQQLTQQLTRANAELTALRAAKEALDAEAQEEE